MLLLVPVLAACDSTSGPVACPASAEPALSVTVRDAETGASLDGALVVARDGAFTDSARTGAFGDEPPVARLALERAGTYEVTAEKEGFSTWSRSGVDVPEGRCGPETVELTARLTPLSS